MVAPVTNYSVHMNARPALSGGAFTAGFAVCNPNNAGWVVANTTNLASGAVDIGGIALETAVSGGASVQVLTAGYCPPEVIGTLSGTGDWVQVGSTGALSRGTSVTSATIGKYQSDGGVIVNLSLQSALVVAAVYDSGYVLVSDYGATDAALTAADAVAQGYTPPKRLLATEQITLANNITVASEMVFEGGSITAASAKTLTLSHSVRPERRRIVFGSAVLAFADDHRQTVIYPEMWGATGTGAVRVHNATGTAATLAIEAGSTTLRASSGMLSTDVGKTVLVFEQVGRQAHRTTVAAYVSSTQLTLASPSTYHMNGLAARAFTFNTTTAINAGTGVIDLGVAHKANTGDRLDYTQQAAGTFQTGLLTGKYHVRAVSSTELAFYDSYADSIADTNRIALTAGGGETHTVTVPNRGTQILIVEDPALDSLAALTACIYASRGEILVELVGGGAYALSGRLDFFPSQGGLQLEGNYAWLRYTGSANISLLSNDDGVLTTNNNRSGCNIRNVNISGSGFARDGIYEGRNATLAASAPMGGTYRNVATYHCTRYGQYYHGVQVARFEWCQSLYTGSHALVFIACNGSEVFLPRGSATSEDGDSVYVDGSALGGGDIFIHGMVCEAVAGYGLSIRDNATTSGTPVSLVAAHLEGVGKDGIYIDRCGVSIGGGISISGPGRTPYYPFRVTADGDCAHIDDSLIVGNFPTANLGGIIETGAANVRVGGIANGTLSSVFDPTVADGWASKLDIRRAAGDLRMQGKLFIGTTSPAPTHSLQLESGSALLDKGNLLQTLGQLGNAYGGVGLGINALVQSETFGTTWTASNCTVTSNAAEGPFGGTVADRAQLTASSGLLRQPVTAATMGGLTVVGSTFVFSVWARAVSGTTGVRLYIINQAGGVEVNGNSFSDWTLTTAWRRIWIAWTSTSSAAPDAIRCGIYGPGATYDIYAWGAQLEFYSASAGLEQRHPGAYAKTIATPRVLATSGGAVANVPQVLPGGTTGAMGAATTDLTITDVRIAATSKIDLYATSAAGLALLASGYWHQTRASGSVVLRFGVASAGGETFEYVIKEAWAA